jgi:hypothetical protein
MSSQICHDCFPDTTTISEHVAGRLAQLLQLARKRLQRSSEFESAFRPSIVLILGPECSKSCRGYELTPAEERRRTLTELLATGPQRCPFGYAILLSADKLFPYLRQHGTTSNSISGEVAGDFMFWPNGKHRFGWYLEPAYDYNFMAGHQQSIGMSAGLLIGIRRQHH